MNHHENYLRDLGFLVKEMAIEAKRTQETESTDFSTGYLCGFHRIVSLMQLQADAFNISRESLCLDDIDPDRDLV
jgi:hypothetical protein